MPGTHSKACHADSVEIRQLETFLAVPDMGVKPCLGAYAQVVTGGTVSVGDQASLS